MGKRIESALEFTSSSVGLTMSFGARASQEILLSGRLADAARLTVIAIDSPDGTRPDVTVIPANTGTSQGLRVGMTGLRVGRGAGHVVVATGLKNPPTLVLPFSWRVDGNLIFEPTNPFLDLRSRDASDGVTVRVSSRRADFRLEAAVVTDGPFEASFAPDEASHAYAVRIRPDWRPARSDARGFVGHVRLVSNDPAEPQKEIPVIGIGAAR